MRKSNEEKKCKRGTKTRDMRNKLSSFIVSRLFSLFLVDNSLFLFLVHRLSFIISNSLFLFQRCRFGYGRGVREGGFVRAERLPAPGSISDPKARRLSNLQTLICNIEEKLEFANLRFEDLMMYRPR